MEEAQNPAQNQPSKLVQNCVACSEILCSEAEIKHSLCNRCFVPLPHVVKSQITALRWKSNLMPNLVLLTLSLLALTLAVYFLPPWPILKWDSVFAEGLFTVILTGVSITLLFGFFLFILADTKRTKRIRDNIAQILHDQDSLPTKSDNKKQLFSVITLRIFFFLGLLANGGYTFYWLNRHEIFSASDSAIISLVTCLGLGFNFAILFLAVKFYREKTEIPLRYYSANLVLIKWWLILVALSFFTAYFGFAYYMLHFGGIFPATDEFILLLRGIFEWGFIINEILFGLAYLGGMANSKRVQHYLTAVSLRTMGGETLTTWDKEDNPLEQKSTFLCQLVNSILLIFYSAIWVVILIIAILCFIIGFYVMSGDIFMFPTYFAPSLLLGFVLPLTIFAIILQHERIHRYFKGRHPFLEKFRFMLTKHKSKRACIYSFAVLGVILLLPIPQTLFWTNFSLERQFTQHFGENWRDQIPADRLNAMLPSPFNLLTAFFGFSIPNNSQIDILYTTDSPRLPQGNSITHEFFFDAYLPPWRGFGNQSPPQYADPSLQKTYTPPSWASAKLPVIITMHGEVEDKGPWNSIPTSQYLANQGYLVCDLNYGYITLNEHGENKNGYTIRQVIEQIGRFTQFLDTHQDEFHADMNHTFFMGRHLGAFYALLAAYGYSSVFNASFSPNMNVSGVIPFYPISDLGTEETSFYGILSQRAYPFMEGSADPNSPDYNPDWVLLNPSKLIDPSINPVATLPLTFLITGTHDYLIPKSYTDRFIEKMNHFKHAIIIGYYWWGSDGFDGAYNSVWGQSTLYYLERFLFLATLNR